MKTSEQILRIKHLPEITGLSKSYIYHLTATGKFPRSIPLVPGGVSRGWLLSEVRLWMEQRIAERDQEEPIS